MTAAALAWRLLRTGGRRGLATLALTATGIAVTAMLLTLTVGAWSGLDARGDRTQWRIPEATDPATALAVQRTTTSALGDEEVVVVDLAASTDGQIPAPPGLPDFPRPGQVFLSPALADLVEAHPVGELADRFGPVTGRMSSAGLAHRGELVAVVGHESGDATMSAPAWRDQTRPDALAGPTPIRDFTGRAVPGGHLEQYRALAQVAAVLLVVPLIVLAGAAARLGLARRDQRLAAVRLAGATPAQAVVMAAVEGGTAALTGSAVGVLAAVALAPFAALIPLDGGRWYPSDLVPPSTALVAVVLGVAVLATASAVLATRQVLSAPLGVAARQTPRRLSPARLVVFAVLVIAFLRFSRSDDTSVTALLLVLAGVFAALAVVGPWVIGLLGRAVVSRSRTAAGLMAGRRLVDDPRGAWRVVGAVAMTGFTAGILALFPTGGGDPVWGEPGRLDVAVQADTASATADALRAHLTAAGVQAEVSSPGTDRGALLALDLAGQEVRFIGVTVPATEHDLSVARTVVARVAPGSVAATGADRSISDQRYLTDFTTGSVLVLGVSFLIAMASAAITSMAAVLDRRRTYRQLSLIGVPLRVLDRARALETVLPLVLLAAGSTLTGIVVAAPVTQLGMGGSAGGSSPGLSGLLLLTGCLVLGVLGVRAASAVSRPLLAKVASDPSAVAD